jgi:hypothetical protein
MNPVQIDLEENCIWIQAGAEVDLEIVLEALKRALKEHTGSRKIPEGFMLRAIPEQEQLLSNIQEYHHFAPPDATVETDSIVCSKEEYVLKFKEYHGPRKEEDDGTVNGRKRIGFK